MSEAPDQQVYLAQEEFPSHAADELKRPDRLWYLHAVCSRAMAVATHYGYDPNAGFHNPVPAEQVRRALDRGDPPEVMVAGLEPGMAQAIFEALQARPDDLEKERLLADWVRNQQRPDGWLALPAPPLDLLE